MVEKILAPIEFGEPIINDPIQAMEQLGFALGRIRALGDTLAETIFQEWCPIEGASHSAANANSIADLIVEQVERAAVVLDAIETVLRKGTAA